MGWVDSVLMQEENNQYVTKTAKMLLKTCTISESLSTGLQWVQTNDVSLTQVTLPRQRYVSSVSEPREQGVRWGCARVQELLSAVSKQKPMWSPSTRGSEFQQFPSLFSV